MMCLKSSMLTKELDWSPCLYFFRVGAFHFEGESLNPIF